MRSRPAAVAGSFYPGDRRRLVEAVDRLLAAARSTSGAPVARRPQEPGPPPIGIIVPHAGYVYSGPVAAAAYVRLARLTDPVDRVVVLGPSHFVPLAGCAVPAADAFQTPLGLVPVDTDCRAALARRPEVIRSDAAHAREHSIEVQLPFLQRALPGDWRLVPVLVGRADPAAVADLLEGVTAPGSLVVCSTDLSHYLDQDTAVVRDRCTAEAVVGRHAGAIGDRDACGAAPLRGVLTWAERHRYLVELLDLRTSGDTAGDRSRVVGYGAFTLVP